MAKVIAIAAWMKAHGPELIIALEGCALGIAGVFAFIPGDQPEKGLRKFAEFVAKFSRKPKGNE